MKKVILFLIVFSIWSCQNDIQESSNDRIYPLIENLYSADPSAHVFDGNLYVYPSHDLDAGVPEDDLGSHFDMRDYHVYQVNESLEALDLGEILNVNQIPWAEKQLWAPDAATKNGTYFFYFPAKDREGIFRIGVATAPTPKGPFTAEPTPIQGAVSIDPCVFVDDDGKAFMYFGGIWGGQLQRWETGSYIPEDIYIPPDLMGTSSVSPNMDDVYIPEDLVSQVSYPTESSMKAAVAGTVDEGIFPRR